jgi:glycosyltransferase involved in cell wall biosynthesis
MTMLNGTNAVDRAERPRPTLDGALFDVEVNAPWAPARPTMSVLVPFLHDDPTDLIRSIQSQSETDGSSVELVVLDDGSNDPDLRERVSGCVRSASIPCAFIVRKRNGGRAAARNTLAQFARGAYFLFNDADCIPDADNFLKTYLALVARDQPAFVVGGFSILQAPTDRRFALHRHITAARDCLPASERQKAPWRYAYGSNILVRRDVMETTPFNPDYLGWGWEDQEWAMRVAKRWPIQHVDNTVSHLGLDDADRLFVKYASSGENFRLIAATHPELLKQYPAYRAAQLLKRMPARGALIGLARRAARSERLPMKLRVFGLRLFRALHYSEAT